LGDGANDEQGEAGKYEPAHDAPEADGANDKENGKDDNEAFHVLTPLRFVGAFCRLVLSIFLLKKERVPSQDWLGTKTTCVEQSG